MFEFIGCIVSSYRLNQYTIAIAVVEELAHASNLVLEVYKLQVKKLKRREINYFTQVYDKQCGNTAIGQSHLLTVRNSITIDQLSSVPIALL